LRSLRDLKAARHVLTKVEEVHVCLVMHATKERWIWEQCSSSGYGASLWWGLAVHRSHA
jgi:hypothetical protein